MSRAPINLLLQANGLSLALPGVVPNWHGTPSYSCRSEYEPSSANDGCSGQMPVSMTPTTTSSPSSPLAQGPLGADRPRNFPELSVVGWRNVLGTTLATF